MEHAISSPALVVRDGQSYRHRAAFKAVHDESQGPFPISLGSLQWAESVHYRNDMRFNSILGQHIIVERKAAFFG